MKRENVLWNVLLGSGVYLIDALRDRLAEGLDDISDRARDTYSEASRRVSRASDVIRGEDHHHLGTAAALLIGIGVGVGVGMLMAPASGEETRSKVSHKVHEFGDRVRDRFSEQRRGAEPADYGT
jgi:YtxH-like protein